MWQTLIKTLQGLTKSYEELFSLQEKKRDTLVTLDLARLEKIVEAEKIYAKEIEKLEKQRLANLIDLSKAASTITADTKMESLAELAPTNELKNKLRVANNALSDIHKKVTELTGSNSLLIEGALMAVNRTLGSISSATVDPVYGVGGSEQTLHRQNFDFKT